MKRFALWAVVALIALGVIGAITNPDPQNPARTTTNSSDKKKAPKPVPLADRVKKVAQRGLGGMGSVVTSRCRKQRCHLEVYMDPLDPQVPLSLYSTAAEIRARRIYKALAGMRRPPSSVLIDVYSDPTADDYGEASMHPLEVICDRPGMRAVAKGGDIYEVCVR